MKLIVREVRERRAAGDCREYDDFCATIVGELSDEGFAAFWEELPAAPLKVSAEETPRSSKPARLIEVMSVLCVA